MPKVPVDRARAREFIRMCDDRLPAIALPTMVKYILPKLRKRWSEKALLEQATLRPNDFLKLSHNRALSGEISEEELQDCYRRIDGLLDVMETELERNGEWITGQFSLADIAIAPYLFRLTRLAGDRFWSKTLRFRVNQWYERMVHRTAFRSAVSWPDESGGGYEEVSL